MLSSNNAKSSLSKVSNWQLMSSLLLTVVTLVVIELLSKTVFEIPNPSPIYLTAVVYAAFSGGFRSGLLSAAIALLYGFYFFSTPGRLFHYTDDNLQRVIVLVVTTPAIAIMVGILKRRAELLAREQVTRAAVDVRQQAEEALRQSEERYRAFLAHSSEGIWRFELEEPISTEHSEDEQIQHFYKYGYLAECNNVMAQMYGFSCAEEIVGARLADLLVQSDPHNIEYLLRFIRSGYKLNAAESYEVDKEGKPKYFLNNLMGIVENGVLVRAWGTQLDITERKQVEEALRLSEAKFRRLVESNIVGVMSADYSGNIKEANDALLQIIGYTREELVAGLIRWREMTPPEHLPKDERAIEEINSFGACAPFEKEYIRKDGSRVPILLACALLEGSQDTTICVILNLTSRKQAEKEREKLLEREQVARAEAEAANRMKDEFLATLSHELRTPLNAMVGWTQMLRTRKFDEKTTARALETIDRNTKSLAQLIEDVLDVSRIITGKLRLNVRPVELVSVISAALETVLPATEGKNIQIESILDPTVALVLGDANRLQQVVWNLLSNAVKFTPSGGRVEVRLERINSRIQIRVSDTGQGIAPDFLPYVFERFRQADSSMTRSHGGLGLGLAIVRHLVELHGGTVKAESPGVGQGATLIVNLPLRAVRIEANQPEQVQPTVTTEVPTICPPSLDGLRVLVVDDEPDARDLLIAVLGEYGAEVTAVATASVALESLKQLQPNVLVSDIGMPGEDGYALIRKVRALDAEQGGRIPAVALTAYARAEDRKQALLAGFQLHVPKPADPAELAAAIANLTGRTEKL